MHPLYCKPIGEITYDDVVSFVQCRVPENKRLEYKTEFSNKDTNKSIAKEVAAFANSSGGLLIFGVEQVGSDDRRPREDERGHDLGRDPRGTVLRICTDRISPSPIIEVSEVLASRENHANQFLLVRVPVSHDVHMLDAVSSADKGRVVYVRTDELSVPERATVHQLEYLFARKAATAERQQARRTQLADQMLGRVDRAEADPCLTTTVGPLTQNDALVTTGDLLNKKLDDFVTESSYRRYGTIPVSNTHPLAVLDGLYSLEGLDGKRGGAVDIYGNVCLVASLETLTFPDDELNGRDMPKAVRRNAEKRALCVMSAEAAEHLVSAIESIRRFSEAIGYFGSLRVTVRADGMKCLVLARDRASWGKELDGFCRAENTITFDEELSTDALQSNDGRIGNLRRLLQRLLWACGVTQAEYVDAAIHEGECMFWGRSTCSCRRTKPSNWTTCPNCAGKTS